MKVIVFGATGRIGRLAVERLLADGHTVTAFARRPKTLEHDDPALLRWPGNALCADEVARAVKGQDAVVVALGAGASRRSKIRSQGTLNVIQAMQRHGVRRLVCQSTLGAHESRGNLNFLWKHILFGLLLKPVLRDHELQESLVRASGLDWTIVRPSSFDDGPATGRFREGFASSERNLTLKIARNDIADFLRKQVTDRHYLHRAVAISN